MKVKIAIFVKFQNFTTFWEILHKKDCSNSILLLRTFRIDKMPKLNKCAKVLESNSPSFGFTSKIILPTNYMNFCCSRIGFKIMTNFCLSLSREGAWVMMGFRRVVWACGNESLAKMPRLNNCTNRSIEKFLSRRHV